MLGSVELPAAILLWVVVGFVVLILIAFVYGVVDGFFKAFQEWKEDRKQARAHKKFMDITTGTRK